MYVVRAKCEIYHPARQMGEEYITPCGIVVPEEYVFQKLQENFPISYLVPRRPPGRRLCFRCKFVSEAQARKIASADDVIIGGSYEPAE